MPEGTKQFLDLEGLRFYDTKIKELIPSSTLDLTNDSGFITLADIPEGPVLATVATSGSYDDLTDKPVIPTVTTATAIAAEDSGYTTGAQVYSYIADLTQSLAGAMQFKGTVNTAADIEQIANPEAGDVYIASAEFTYNSEDVEPGDLVVYQTSTTPAGWTVIQGNIEGAVTGPVEATDAHIALFDGVSGKVIKDSGVALSELTSELNTRIESLEESGEGAEDSEIDALFTE